MPFSDMFNHDNNDDAIWRYNSESGSTDIVTDKAVPFGKQITISYGERANWELLDDYGFTMANNTVLKAPIVFSLPEGDPVAIMHKRLKQLGWQNTVTVKIYVRPAIETKEFHDIMKLARISVATELQLNEDDINFNEVVSVENERQALSFILTSIWIHHLNRYPTSISDDKRMLEQNSLSSNIRNIVMARISEKESLMEFYNTVEALLWFAESNTLEQLRQKIKNHPVTHGFIENYLPSLADAIDAEDDEPRRSKKHN